MSDKQLKKYTPSAYKDFRQHDNMREERGRLDNECEHRLWVKRCSICKAILESDSKVNLKVGENSKVHYHGFDKVVCSFKLAKKIKDLNVPQKSLMYWMHNLENDYYSIRTYENVLLQGNEVVSAFTSSELVILFNRLPKSIMKAKIYEYIGANACIPDRLARLYVKLKQQHQHEKNSI